MVAEAKIKILRDNKKWSQAYMAESMGMSQPAYSKLESGQTKLTIERADELAKMFEIEPEYFFSSDSASVQDGKDYSYGPIQHNTNHLGGKKYEELYAMVIKEKDQRIEQFEQEVLFLKKELALASGQLAKLINRLSDKL